MHDTQIVFWKDEKYSVMNATKNRKKRKKIHMQLESCLSFMHMLLKQ